MAGDNQKPLIVILGPTAIGKTGLALDIAEAVNGEIIGADSRQVYRYMDIGTAKPTPAQQARVPHHLVDFIDPGDNLTLARYQQMVYQTIDILHGEGKIPLLVGGTGQYITAVTEGWSIPEVPPNEAVRSEFEEFARIHGNDALYTRLEALDPAAARKIHPNNVRRVIRALEVYMETGERISELQKKKPPPYRIMELGLYLERLILYERADKRVDEMMIAGFLSEVSALLDMGYSPELPSMSGLGYAQLTAHLLSQVPLATAVEDTKIATHDFIRRQLTWFRGHDNGILWHNVEHVCIQQVVEFLFDWLNHRRK
ncbi:MAG: tRNA (adenosine(37)-N6)-dimethylallyltransferase MiaA [Chloroflexota bacterium]